MTRWIVPAFTMAVWPCGATIGADLNGRVLEMYSGQPVEEARLAFRPLSRGGQEATADTGEDGRFQVKAFVAGRYRVDAARVGYAASTLYFDYADGAAVVVRLARLGAIQGSVTNAAGEPISGASVFPSSPWLRRLAVRTDDRGRYRLFNLPPGDHAVAAVHAGAVASAGGSSSRGDLVLPGGPAFAIEGRVEPHPEAGSMLVTAAQSGVSLAQALTAKAGRFRIEGLRQGRYEIYAAGPTDLRLNGGFGGLLLADPKFGRTEVTVISQDQRDVQIATQAGATAAFRLTGRGQMDESGLCGDTATLSLTALEAWGARVDRKAAVKAGADAPVNGLAPARYRVSLAGLPDSCYYLGEAVLDFSAGVPARVELPRGRGATLSGRTAGAGYIVLLQPEAAEEGDAAFIMVAADREGRFSLESLRPGTYRTLAVPAREWSSPEWRPEAGQMTALQLVRGTTNLELSAPPARTR